MRYRVENFKSLVDTGLIDIAPLTVFIGSNGTGKSSVLQPLLALAQTLTNSRDEVGFLPNGEYLKLGNYDDFVFQHDSKRKIIIYFEDEQNYKNYPKRCRKSKDVSKLQDIPIGELPPSKYSIVFVRGRDNLPEVGEVNIWDCMDRLLLSRKRGKSGKYNLNFWCDIEKDKEDLFKSIEVQKPRNFVFDDYDVVKTAFHENKDIRKESIKIARNIAAYLNTISYTKQWFIKNLRRIKYIGPIREEARRIYEYNRDYIEDVGHLGKNTAFVLYQNSNLEDKKNILTQWLVKFSLAEDFRVVPVENHPELFSLEFQENGKDYFINYADTCFGMSQLLPILVQLVYSTNNDIVIIEQPELHLNPRLEAILADFFVEMASGKEKKFFMIETHSEYLLLRLRTHIRTGKIDNKKVALYFAESMRGRSSIRRIVIDSNADFPNDDWPAGFFEQSLAENLMFVTAGKNG